MSKFYTNVERYGNSILWRGYDNGRQFMKKVQFQPTLYLPVKENAEYKTLIDEKPIGPKKFESMSAAKDFIERYSGVEGFGIAGNTNYVAQFIQENYPGEIKFDMNLINIAKFDIEVDISDGYANVEEADKEITSISFKSSKSDTYHLLGRKDYDKYQTITGIDPENIQFMKFDDEKSMLRRFIQIWTNDYPDVITGWNVEYFDIMYTVTRIMRLFSEDKARELSPWRSIRKHTREIFGKPQSTYAISGIAVIDYMDAFKKFGYKYGPQESYKLDHIAHVVLGEKKLSYERFGNHVDTHKFITDGAKDVKIPDEIPDTMLDEKEKYVRMRDKLKEEIKRRGLNI